MNKSSALAFAVLSNLMAACAFWVIYCYYQSNGLWVALLSFVGLSVAYKFGPAPLFAVSATLLHFQFQVVGLWLPIASYIWAAVTLLLTAIFLRQAEGPEAQ